MSDLAVPGLVQEVRTYGRFDVNACLNCGSCTIVCDLSHGEASFPRRPLQRTLLGLKSALLNSLEPWLCHNCGDCSTACPREAEPRESMMTLRRYLAAQYDLTGLSRKIFASRRGELISIAALALFVFGLVIAYHLYYVQLPMADLVSTSMGLEHMFDTIIYFTVAVFAIPLLLMTANAVHMHRFTMRRDAAVRIPFRLYLVEARTLIMHLLSQRDMGKCPTKSQKRLWMKHRLLGLACAVMFVVPLFFLRWFQTDSVYPLYNPQRWLGYLVTAIMIYVPADILIGRMRKREPMYKFSESSDLTFPVMLLLVAFTGIAVHIFRYLEFAMACHYAYALHMAITVPFLVIEMPFGKWSHVLYRPLAIYLQTVKVRAMAEAKTVAHEAPSEESILTGTHAA
jgi:ferredoxin